MFKKSIAWAACLSLTIAAAAVASDLEAPVPLYAGSQPIDVEHQGHAAPFVGDYDGDGRKDLLVGEFYKGRLRIYRNDGTNRQPRLEKYSIFHDEAVSGCIPAS
jgi:hypothetical protein